MPIIINYPENVFSDNNNLKILLLRQDRLGDLLISTSTIRILRKALPDAQIDILLGIKNKSLKQAVSNYINKNWLYDKKFWDTLFLIKKLRKEKYDIVIDMFDNASATSSMFVKYLKAKISIGIDKENRNIYTHIVNLLDKNKYHPIERLAQVLLLFGINPENEDLSLEYKLTENDIESAEKKIGKKMKAVRLGINLAGSDIAKFWGVGNNIDFINRIASAYPVIEIIIFAEKKYSNQVKEISEKTTAKAAPFVETVHEFAFMLSLCDIIITPDTSAVHFASAFKIPCIALYNYSPESSTGIPWFPYKTPNKILTNPVKLPDIKIEEVFQAFEELYNEEIKHK